MNIKAIGSTHLIINQYLFTVISIYWILSLLLLWKYYYGFAIFLCFVILIMNEYKWKYENKYI